MSDENKVGRPPLFSPEGPPEQLRRMVESMSGFGVPHEDIAACVNDGISVESLLKYFPRELKLGRAKANAKVGERLWTSAINGDTTAGIWWTKTQMGWRGTDDVNLSGGLTIKIGKEFAGV